MFRTGRIHGWSRSDVLKHRCSEAEAARFVRYGIVGAYSGAVKAYNTPRGVDNFLGQLYALRLAYAVAFAAVDAQVRIDFDVEIGSA